MNNKKGYVFNDNKRLFEKYMDKIIHIVIELPNSNNPWINEKYQRNSISKGIEKLNLNNDYIIIISDCNEIPYKNELYNIKFGTLILNENI
jgi:beta-1,4-mannosyl-glycoprotein beta-1,4-N-acetylglucosaminyltransferase